METYIDLHTHTRYSDGDFKPEQIIELTALNGIELVAITDHDNFRGYFDGIKTAKRYGITLIPGAEITTPNYHLLALNFNPHDKKFYDFVEHSRELQREVCQTRVNILKGDGIPLTMEKVDAEYPNARVGKWNLRTILQKDRECREYLDKRHPTLSPVEKYFQYLGKGGIAADLEPRLGVSSQEAIAAAHAAGGIIGIAHPQKDIKSIEELEVLLKQGIDFVEIQPNIRAKHPDREIKKFIAKHNLPTSYGSDYHTPAMGRPMFLRGENVLHQDLKKLLEETYKSPFG